MIFIFSLSYILTYLITKSIQKKFEKRKKLPEYQQVQNFLRGGQQIILELEAAQVILQCVEDGKDYLVTNPQLAEIIRSMIRTGFKKHSYIISQQFARYLALKLGKNKSGVLLVAKDVLFFTENYGRLVTRIAISGTLGVVTGVGAAIFSTFMGAVPYAVLMMILSFELSSNCGVDCDYYLQELPSNKEEIMVLVDRDDDNLIITSHEHSNKVAIYVPEENQVLESPVTDSTRKLRPYIQSRKKAKMVDFKEWSKTDPELQTLYRENDDLERIEGIPYVPQRKCELQKAENVGLE